MAGSLNNVANLRRVVVGFKGHETCDKPKIADFFTCLVHHFSPNELSTTVNCGIQDDMLVLYSPSNRKNYNCNLLCLCIYLLNLFFVKTNIDLSSSDCYQQLKTVL